MDSPLESLGRLPEKRSRANKVNIAKQSRSGKNGRAKACKTDLILTEISKSLHCIVLRVRESGTSKAGPDPVRTLKTAQDKETNKSKEVCITSQQS